MNIPFRQSPNFSTTTKPKIGWVFHGTLGAYQGAVDWLCNGNRYPRTSAHYVIGRKEGEITQIVANRDVAWHAGIISEPNAKARRLLKKNLDGTYENPNQSWIGIEFAWGYDIDGDGKVTAYDKTLTPWQIKAVVTLIKSYPEIPQNILTHSDIASYKADNLSEWVDLVQKKLGAPEEMVAVQVPKSKVEEVLAFIKTL